MNQNGYIANGKSSNKLSEFYLFSFHISCSLRLSCSLHEPSYRHLSCSLQLSCSNHQPNYHHLFCCINPFYYFYLLLNLNAYLFLQMLAFNAPPHNDHLKVQTSLARVCKRLEKLWSSQANTWAMASLTRLVPPWRNQIITSFLLYFPTETGKRKSRRTIPTIHQQNV